MNALFEAIYLAARLELYRGARVKRPGSEFNGRVGSQHIPRPRHHDAITDIWLTTDKDFADGVIGYGRESANGVTLVFWDRWLSNPTLAFFYYDELEWISK